MNNLKRSYNSIKGTSKNVGKGKDPAKTMNMRQKLLEEENEVHYLTLPIIKQADNMRLLPRYASVLTRSAEDGVGMKDLDQLQQDFENLLSTCAVRYRLLKAEIDTLDKTEEKKEKRAHLKRKRPDDKVNKYKEMKSFRSILKPKPSSTFINDLPLKQEVPKVSLPTHDTDKFWLSIDPYCCDVLKEDVNFLDELITECSQEIDVKIPELGEHYSFQWNDNTINHEQQVGNVPKSMKLKNSTYNNDMKKNGLNMIVETFRSPLTHRLLSALLEEKVFKSYPPVIEKLKASDFVIKSTNGMRGGHCLDQRLAQELIEQEILEVDDLPKTFPPEDEILMEIKKCQQELSVVNEHNQHELNKLRTCVAKDLRRQEVKAALDKVDNQIIQMYYSMLLKQDAGLDDDEAPTKECMQKYQIEAKKLIDQQNILHKELTDLTDISNLY